MLVWSWIVSLDLHKQMSNAEISFVTLTVTFLQLFSVTSRSCFLARKYIYIVLKTYYIMYVESTALLQFNTKDLYSIIVYQVFVWIHLFICVHIGTLRLCVILFSCYAWLLRGTNELKWVTGNRSTDYMNLIILVTLSIFLKLYCNNIISYQHFLSI